jgi:hypothetical protein
MTRSSQPLVAVIVALGLAVPAVASAQRTAPPGSSSSGSASSRGGSSGSSGGGGAVGTSGSSGGSGGSVAPGGSAVSRGSNGDGSATPQGSTRDRNGRPVVGTASTRMLGTVTGLPGPTFGPWGRYFPWYSTGFGWNYGFFQYDPFYAYGYDYGYGLGPWYDPFYYDPFNPFGYGYGMFRYGGYYSPSERSLYMGGASSGRYSSSSSSTTHLTGSIRLKVSPDTAKVYIDGVLAGTAGEFDGLVSHHLTLEGGTHQLELRADGYETYQSTLTVDPGKTLTERVSMKKSK